MRAFIFAIFVLAIGGVTLYACKPTDKSEPEPVAQTEPETPVETQIEPASEPVKLPPAPVTPIKIKTKQYREPDGHDPNKLPAPAPVSTPPVGKPKLPHKPVQTVVCALIGDVAAEKLHPHLKECTRYSTQLLRQSEAKRIEVAGASKIVVALDRDTLCHPEAVKTMRTARARYKRAIIVVEPYSECATAAINAALVGYPQDFVVRGYAGNGSPRDGKDIARVIRADKNWKQ